MDLNHLPSPLPAVEIDRRFHLRKGTTRKAVNAGRLRTCIRPGRGGLTCWILPESALAWFHAGIPTEPEVSLKKSAKNRFTVKPPRARRTYRKKNIPPLSGAINHKDCGSGHCLYRRLCVLATWMWKFSFLLRFLW